MSVGDLSNAIECMTVSTITWNKAIRQITKTMPMPSGYRRATAHAMLKSICLRLFRSFSQCTSSFPLLPVRYDLYKRYGTV